MAKTLEEAIADEKAKEDKARESEVDVLLKDGQLLCQPGIYCGLPPMDGYNKIIYDFAERLKEG